MEGSSAFQFGRAAYRAGLLSRRQLLSDAWDNLQFRLRGASDEASHALRDRISHALGGHAGCGTSSGSVSTSCAGSCRGSTRRCWPSPTSTRTPGAGRTSPPPPRRSSPPFWRTVLALDGGIGSQFSEVVDGVFTGKPTGLFIYGAEKAAAIEQLARREGIDLAGLVRLLRLRLGSADAATGRASRGRQPRRASCCGWRARKGGRCSASTAWAFGSRRSPGSWALRRPAVLAAPCWWRARAGAGWPSGWLRSGAACAGAFRSKGRRARA